MDRISLDLLSSNRALSSFSEIVGLSGLNDSPLAT